MKNIKRVYDSTSIAMLIVIISVFIYYYVLPSNRDWFNEKKSAIVSSYRQELLIQRNIINSLVEIKDNEVSEEDIDTIMEYYNGMIIDYNSYKDMTNKYIEEYNKMYNSLDIISKSRIENITETIEILPYQLKIFTTREKAYWV